MMKVSLMKAITKPMMLAMPVLLMLTCPGPLAGNPNSEKLQGKTADIKLLHQQLAQRKQEASAILQGIEAQRDELMNEIRVISKSLKFDSYDKARHNLRVYYNIELLRSLLSYIQAFETKIRFYRTGHDRLTYFRQLVQDDIKLTSTLDVYEIDALTTQISMVINKYLADAHIIRVDPQPDHLVSATEVWDRVKGDLQ